MGLEVGKEQGYPDGFLFLVSLRFTEIQYRHGHVFKKSTARFCGTGCLKGKRI